MAAAASLKRKASSASVTAAAARSLSPAIQRLTVSLRRGRIEALDRHAAVHLGEARGVPQLGREIAIALDARGRELDVAPLRGHGGEREAERVGAVAVDQLERIDDVALRLRHLLALLVADQRVDVDLAERHLVHEVEAHHHHAGDPEEDDVEAGDEHVGRVVARELRRLVRPAEGRERPKPEENQVSSTSSSRLELDASAVMRRWRGDLAPRLVLGDEDLAVGPVPGGDLMAPPELARDAPGLDVLHPVEVGLLPVLRHEHGAAALDRVDGGLRQLPRVHVPLVGQERLDDDVRAVAMRHGVDVRLDLLDQPLLLQPRDDRLPRREAVEAVRIPESSESSSGLGSTPGMKSGLWLEHELQLRRSRMLIIGSAVALADLEIVEVVRRA